LKHMLKKYLGQFTSLSEEEQSNVLDEIVVEEYPRGTTLLRQGDIPTKCYFVLKGCVRQYAVDEAGKETTSNFYTEEQAIAAFHRYKRDQASGYSFVCVEDCVLVVGDLDGEASMFEKYTQLETMTRKMVEEHLSDMQDEFAAFIAASPEDRYKALLRNRPGLADRVPQHQLASYLGMTPESLSRIKKRLHSERPSP